jgi:hypothetical protein
MLGYSHEVCQQVLYAWLSYFPLATNLFVISFWLLTFVSRFRSRNLTFFYQRNASAYRRFLFGVNYEDEYSTSTPTDSWLI